MSDNKKKIHRTFAVDCFNGTWDLIEKFDRTPEEDTKMIHMAHASRFHWGEIGTPLEFARGDWQLSRVYAILGKGKTAYHFAQTSLNHCLENNFGDFDLAFAYEALARSAAVIGDDENLVKYTALARKAGDAIVKDGDRDYFFRELDSIN